MNRRDSGITKRRGMTITIKRNGMIIWTVKTWRKRRMT